MQCVFCQSSDTFFKHVYWVVAMTVCDCCSAGARVLSAETVTVRVLGGHQHGNPEVTYTYNHPNRPEQHLYVLRVYLDGIYQEPPPSVLPAPPLMQQSNNDDCCVIL